MNYNSTKRTVKSNWAATLSLFILCFAQAATVLAGSSSNPVMIEKMNECEQMPEENPAFVLFDQSTNLFYGWSHIFDNPDNFPGLKLQSDLYRVDSGSVATDDVCGDITVFKSVFVKKYANWDQQHANGLETQFPEQEITFGEVKDIVLELKINSDQTFIPSLQDYLDTYEPYTAKSNLLEMDQGKVNLGITLFSENEFDQSIETFRGVIYLELSQRVLADQWLRVVIPAESLQYAVQQNYADTEKNLEDYLDSRVVGLRINPETANGKVLRNYISETFDESVPEMYKEQGISIRRVAIDLNEVTTCPDGEACSDDDTSGDDDSGNDDDTSGDDDSGNDDDTSGDDDSGNDDDTSGDDDSGNDDDTSGDDDPGNGDETDGPAGEGDGDDTPVSDDDNTGDDSANYIVVEKMDQCEQMPEESPAFVLFDQSSNLFYGWSHILDNPDNFPGLKLQPDQYRVDSESVTTDDVCSDITVFKSVFVKKYANWDQQHANGLETQFPEQGIVFGQVKDVVLELKINSDQTFIPSQQEYLNTYEPYTDRSNLLEMDRGEVNLGITLFSENEFDQSIETFRGVIYLELNQQAYADRWLRIVIPAESLQYAVQQNFADTAKNLADYLDSSVVGMRINPETRNGRVLRNYISETFDDSVPEMYKEQGISIRRVAIGLNEVVTCPDAAACTDDDTGDNTSGEDDTGSDNTEGPAGDSGADDTPAATESDNLETLTTATEVESSGGGSFGILGLAGFLFMFALAALRNRALIS